MQARCRASLGLLTELQPTSTAALLVVISTAVPPDASGVACLTGHQILHIPPVPGCPDREADQGGQWESPCSNVQQTDQDPELPACVEKRHGIEQRVSAVTSSCTPVVLSPSDASSGTAHSALSEGVWCFQSCTQQRFTVAGPSPVSTCRWLSANDMHVIAIWLETSWEQGTNRDEGSMRFMKE